MTKTNDRRLVNKTELAGLLDVSTQALDGWLRRGMPYVSAPGEGGRSYRFDVAAVLAWRVDYLTAAATAAAGSGDDLDEARRRRAVAEASMAELDLEQRRGELYRRADVDAAVTGAFARVRARLLAVPVKVAPMVAPQRPAEAEKAVRAAINEALRGLSETSMGDLCGEEAPETA